MTASEVSGLVANVTVGIVAVFVIQAVFVYAIVKQLVSGRSLVERREQPEQRARIVGMDR